MVCTVPIRSEVRGSAPGKGVGGRARRLLRVAAQLPLIERNAGSSLARAAVDLLRAVKAHHRVPENLPWPWGRARRDSEEAINAMMAGTGSDMTRPTIVARELTRC